MHWHLMHMLETLARAARRTPRALTMPLGLGVAFLALVAVPAMAAAPEPWQMGLQPAAAPIMERVASFHTLLLWIITLVCIVVLGLLAYVWYKFREDKNPEPSKRSHNTLLEVVWTAVPVLILVIIAVPSFKLLYFQDVQPDTEFTIKAIGRQWYWSYEYPDHGNFTFDAIMLSDEEVAEMGGKRLLETDNQVVIPADTNVKILVTASDVLHSWAMPSMGVKTDAVPGRLNEIWVNVSEPGTYYGQCSELCGTMHAFMPIAVRVVPRDEFDKWIEEAQVEFAKVDDPGVAVADATDPRPAASE